MFAKQPYGGGAFLSLKEYQSHRVRELYGSDTKFLSNPYNERRIRLLRFILWVYAKILRNKQFLISGGWRGFDSLPWGYVFKKYTI